MPKELVVFEPISDSDSTPTKRILMNAPRVRWNLVEWDALKANLEEVIAGFDEVVGGVNSRLTGSKIAYLDLSLGVKIDGTVGLFGTKFGTEGSGGIVVRVVPREQV